MHVNINILNRYILMKQSVARVKIQNIQQLFWVLMAILEVDIVGLKMSIYMYICLFYRAELL